MSSYRDQFDVVNKVKYGFVLKCKRCGKVTKSHWGLARRHLKTHGEMPPSVDNTPPTQPA